jgi:GTPase involved in cell partitioning and DNA repair
MSNLNQKEINSKLKELADAPYGKATTWIRNKVDPYWKKDEGKKKKYIVEIYENRSFKATVQVEACCEEEAENLANNMDSLDWEDTGHSEWEETNVCEVENE